MARSLEQLDMAVRALQVSVDNTYRGLMDTMRQLAAALEVRMQAIEDALGQAPSPGAAGSGILGELADVRILLADLQAAVEQLRNQQP